MNYIRSTTIQDGRFTVEIVITERLSDGSDSSAVHELQRTLEGEVTQWTSTNQTTPQAPSTPSTPILN